jgi:SnoaL-like domain
VSPPAPAGVAELLDRAAIQDVLLRYCRGADRCDEELIRSGFDPAFLTS